MLKDPGFELVTFRSVFQHCATTADTKVGYHAEEATYSSPILSNLPST